MDLPPEKHGAITFAAATQSISWAEQDELLREMWLRHEKPENIAERLGRSVAAIMTRAARLGLPRRAAPGRKPGCKYKGKRSGSVTKKAALQQNQAAGTENTSSMKMVRICLMCLNRFYSEGRHNRICSNCKNTAEYSAGCSIPEMFKNA